MEDRRAGLITTAFGLVVLLVGVALVVDAVRRGEASVVLVVVVPVVYGASAELAAGIVFLLAAIFLVSLGRAQRAGPADPADGTATGADRSSGAMGGVLLLGPVPIFFGSARRVSRRTYLLAVLAGAALFAAALAVVAFGLLGR